MLNKTDINKHIYLQFALLSKKRELNFFYLINELYNIQVHNSRISVYNCLFYIVKKRETKGLKGIGKVQLSLIKKTLLSQGSFILLCPSIGPFIGSFRQEKEKHEALWD